MLVTKVMPDSPAAKAGLQENDVIIKLGDISLSGPRSVTEALSEKVPGDKITAVFYRKGKRETADVTLDMEVPPSRRNTRAAQGDPRTQPRVVPSVRRQAVPPAGMAARPNLPQRILDMQQMMDDFLRDSAIDDSRMDDIIGRMNPDPGAAQIPSFQNLHQMPMPHVARCPAEGRARPPSGMSDANGTIVVSSSPRGTTVHDGFRGKTRTPALTTRRRKGSQSEAVRGTPEKHRNQLLLLTSS